MTRRIGDAAAAGFIAALNARFGGRNINGFKFPMSRLASCEYWADFGADGLPTLFFEVRAWSGRAEFGVIAFRRDAQNARRVVEFVAALLRRFGKVSFRSECGDRYRGLARIAGGAKTRRGGDWWYCLRRERSLERIEEFLRKRSG